MARLAVAVSQQCVTDAALILRAGVPLVLNVSDPSAPVSLTPALKHPNVDGIRVEVNGQVRPRLLLCKDCSTLACYVQGGWLSPGFKACTFCWQPLLLASMRCLPYMVRAP